VIRGWRRCLLRLCDGADPARLERPVAAPQRAADLPRRESNPDSLIFLLIGRRRPPTARCG
jgi:hypothetical protein